MLGGAAPLSWSEVKKNVVFSSLLPPRSTSALGAAELFRSEQKRSLRHVVLSVINSVHVSSVRDPDSQNPDPTFC